MQLSLRLVRACSIGTSSMGGRDISSSASRSTESGRVISFTDPFTLIDVVSLKEL